jgi:hypothetical protein
VEAAEGETSGIRLDPPARRVAVDGLQLVERGDQAVDGGTERPERAMMLAA